MSASLSRLEQYILPDYELTLRDEIVTQLLDYIQCLIKREVENDNIHFRKQCYQRDSWSRLLDE